DRTQVRGCAPRVSPTVWCAASGMLFGSNCVMLASLEWIMIDMTNPQGHARDNVNNLAPSGFRSLEEYHRAFVHPVWSVIITCWFELTSIADCRLCMAAFLFQTSVPNPAPLTKIDRF